MPGKQSSPPFQSGKEDTAGREVRLMQFQTEPQAQSNILVRLPDQTRTPSVTVPAMAKEIDRIMSAFQAAK
ncbi:hypothetical protein V8F33_000477 [Rhypophila sp. PSN 637]